MRALMVEDNFLNSELAKTVLEIAGHHVQVVVDGASFRAAVQDGAAPHIVLMDVLLPDASGIELLAELRASGKWATVPVVALTAQALAGDKERLQAAGFIAVLTKPIDTRMFARQVKELATAD